MAGSLEPRRAGGDEIEETHEINVTPFIDVMLVLLIIFMIAAPLATVDIPVDLPNSGATPQPRPADPIYLTVERDLGVTLGAAPVPPGGLGAALERATGGDRETRVFLRADETVPYGELMKVMEEMRGAGYLKVALVALGTAAPASQ